MLRSDQIRQWQRIGLCCLVMVASSLSAIASTETSTPPKKPSQASASTGAKAKHPASASTATHSSKKSVHASSRTPSSSPKSKSSGGKKSSRHVAKKRGQQAIDSDRAREIQTALIRQHYMEGEPSGKWDSATQAAMQRYQTDQGWQSKTTPDSRALIKLGLGPSHDHLLNPENAMTAPPPDSKAAKQAPAEDNLPHQ